MRRFWLILVVTLLAIMSVLPAAAQKANAQSPVVHVVMFWMDGCPHCEAVKENLLPQLQAQYGEQLDLQMVEVFSTEDVERLYQIGASFGLEQEEVGVPLVIIADQVLVGDDQIPAQLPGLIERYLSEGGAAAPDLEKLAAGGVVEAEPQNDGMVVAWVVLVGMVLAVVFAAVVLGAALQSKQLFRTPAWLDLAFPILGVIGMGVALYLLYVESSSAQAICGPVGDCNAVQDSPYAMIFGILPVGLAGVLGYLAILGAWFFGKRSPTGLGAYVPAAMLGFSVFGTLFSVYLTYLEIFVIHAVCMWCITSAIVMTLILLASLPKAAAWLAAADEDESD